MSEQQVLPEFIATLKAAAEKATPRRGFIDAKDGVEFNRLTPPAVILKLIASLAQSEAERERLQGEVEDKKESWTFADEEQIVDLRAALARERELIQGLRQVVKDAYDYIPMETLRLKIRNLLDKSKPVVTNTEEE